MKKKWIKLFATLFVCATLALGFTACGDKENKGSNTGGTSTEQNSGDSSSVSLHEHEYTARITAPTCTAQWQINQYTLTIVYGNGEENKTITQDYNTPIEEIANPNERAGYDFDGWDKTIPTSMPAQNLTIYCEAKSKPSGWDSNWNNYTCPVYWYSETEPTTTGNYWHYDENGEIAVW